MSDAWIVVVLVGAFTIAFKAAGPVLSAGRPLPARLARVELLAPSLLAALVVTQSVGGKREIVLDARLAGLAAAAVAIWLSAPLIVVFVVAALATALVRASEAQDCGSPSQQPSLNRHRGHCQVPWRHSIGAAHRKQSSIASSRCYSSTARRRSSVG